ncbi:arsenate reductase (glutaredoxin) [Pelomonas sp. SE-A7]|uniref:arsenate reductase (glutaredoxin) n=1 Tax=Pelomonas sp. SE-A7 TaxID=3054953 RepID=UPI00259CE2A7|nr:arsenate reductase (glutaredoxin) [Pelomonas sp. SE-A7]MDM4767265.1 arsenate reductase (glutaredoxin) [Pelomonas sp. SE-A7]
MSIRLIHNPGCSKSRAALALLEQQGLPFETIDYLASPLTLDELRDLQRQLDLPARALLRESEDDFARLGLADPTLCEEQLLTALASHPPLLQRPIVLCGDRALIARPPELLLAFLAA